jgi:hypothetical protein
LLAVICWLLGTDFFSLAGGSVLLAVSCGMLAPVFWLQAASCWPLALGYWLLASGCLLVAAGYWLFDSRS